MTQEKLSQSLSCFLPPLSSSSERFWVLQATIGSLFLILLLFLHLWLTSPRKGPNFYGLTPMKQRFSPLRGPFVPPPSWPIPSWRSLLFCKLMLPILELSQLDDFNREHVISYDGSRSLSDREKSFSATKKEALAAVFAVDRFFPYLLSRKFALVTDHSALRWFHSVKAKGRLAR